MNDRELRFRQARHNACARRPLLDALEGTANWFGEIPVEITGRTEHWDVTKFKATKLRRAEHFPYIVPELVDDSGDYMLITWLSFGSLLRLYKTVCER